MFTLCSCLLFVLLFGLLWIVCCLLCWWLLIVAAVCQVTFVIVFAVSGFNCLLVCG